MNDEAYEISKKLFNDIDRVIGECITNLKDNLSEHNIIYQIIMSALASLTQKHCEILTRLFIHKGSSSSERHIYMTLIDQISNGCKNGFDELSKNNKTKH